MKISVNDFVIMAVAAAFQDVPDANVTWSDEGLVAAASVDVSIAVATDGGLVTPVLRGVGAKRLSVIAAEARSLAERARNRRLQQHELEGGVFSISNLGMYGTLEFSAIINPPQSGILAVGAATPQAVVVDGAVTVATVMRCTLSVDHRAIDGALAARWLAAFTARIQDPLGMLVYAGPAARGRALASTVPWPAPCLGQHPGQRRGWAAKLWWPRLAVRPPAPG